MAPSSNPTPAIRARAQVARHAVALMLAICGLITAAPAHALRPKPDFFIRVSNLTGHPVDICHTAFTHCETIAPGASYVDAQATGRPQVAHLAPWMQDTVLRTCNRVFPIKSVATAPRFVEDWRSLTIHLALTKENHRRACGAIGQR